MNILKIVFLGTYISLNLANAADGSKTVAAKEKAKPAVMKKTSFEELTRPIEYSRELTKLIKIKCLTNCPEDTKKDQNIFNDKTDKVQKVLIQDMEKQFQKAFTPAEMKYIEELMKHKLMKRLYEFRITYLNDPKTVELVTNELKK